MEVCQIAQIVYIFIIFLLTLVFVLLPLKLIPADHVQLGSRRSQRIIDLCNCFAGGVFLGTCFVQLVPYVEMKFHDTFAEGGMTVAYASTLTQVTVMLGFFLVLLMEQVVKTCQKSSRVKGVTASEQEMSAVKGSYIVAVSTDDESQCSDGSDVELTREKKRMLKPKDKTGKVKTTKKSKCKHMNSPTDQNQFREPNGTGKGLVADRATDHGAVGHSHVHLADLAQEEFGLRCVVLLFALSLHSLFEGMAIGLQTDLLKLINLAIGISVHECLVAFALGISLARQNLARSTVVKLSIAFSVAIPIGIGVGMGVGGIHNFASGLISAVLQGLTAGTFVYVIFVEILPGEVDRNRDRLLKVFIMFVGFCIISSMRFLMKGH